MSIPVGATRSSTPLVNPPAQPRYRSGAVARMLRMPVATLRIWERRYRVAAPATTASGHRLYSAQDVQRLALLRQLTDLGHAIGALAHLSVTELREVASTHAGAVAASRQNTAPTAAWRVIAIGNGLVQRLRRSSVQRRLRRPIDIVSAHESASAARMASTTGPADVLLLQAHGLHDSSLAEIQSLRQRFGVSAVVVLYGFAAEALVDALVADGVTLLREPQDDRALADGLAALSGGPTPSAVTVSRSVDEGEFSADDVFSAPQPAGPRRYDDAALVEFAGLSTTISCECPRHVAEILMQLSRFEAYTAECANQGPADAALHDYLGRVAGASRALFETALERLAVQEGLMLAR